MYVLHISNMYSTCAKTHPCTKLQLIRRRSSKQYNIQHSVHCIRIHKHKHLQFLCLLNRYINLCLERHIYACIMACMHSYSSTISCDTLLHHYSTSERISWWKTRTQDTYNNTWHCRRIHKQYTPTISASLNRYTSCMWKTHIHRIKKIYTHFKWIIYFNNLSLISFNECTLIHNKMLQFE